MQPPVPPTPPPAGGREGGRRGATEEGRGGAMRGTPLPGGGLAHTSLPAGRGFHIRHSRSEDKSSDTTRWQITTKRLTFIFRFIEIIVLLFYKLRIQQSS